MPSPGPLHIAVTDAEVHFLYLTLQPWLSALASLGAEAPAHVPTPAPQASAPLYPTLSGALQALPPPLFCIHALSVGGVKARLTAKVGDWLSSSSMGAPTHAVGLGEGSGGAAAAAAATSAKPITSAASAAAAAQLPPAFITHIRMLEILSPNKMPFRTSPLTLLRALSPLSKFRDMLLAFFAADLVLTLPALLGSFDLLGNPTNLFRSIFAGAGEVLEAAGALSGSSVSVSSSVSSSGAHSALLQLSQRSEDRSTDMEGTRSSAEATRAPPPRPASTLARSARLVGSIGRLAGHVSGGVLASVGGCAGALSTGLDRAVQAASASAAAVTAVEAAAERARRGGGVVGVGSAGAGGAGSGSAQEAGLHLSGSGRRGGGGRVWWNGHLEAEHEACSPLPSPRMVLLAVELEDGAGAGALKGSTAQRPQGGSSPAQHSLASAAAAAASASEQVDAPASLGLLLRGVGVGLLGAALRPLSGALGIVAHTALGLKEAVGGRDTEEPEPVGAPPDLRCE